MFATAIRAMIFRSVPPRSVDAAARMYSVFWSSGMMLSVFFYFALLVVGLSSTLPAALVTGLTAQGVPAAVAHQVALHPPASDLFAAFLGYNPVSELLAPTGVLARLPAHSVTTLTSGQFFPRLIAAPFSHGLVLIFVCVADLLVAAIFLSVVAWSRRDNGVGSPP